VEDAIDYHDIHDNILCQVLQQDGGNVNLALDIDIDPSVENGLLL
jgi:hypothetical protein